MQSENSGTKSDNKEKQIKIIKILLVIFALIVVAAGWSYIECFIPRNLHIYKEFEFDVKKVKIFDGDTWDVVTSIESRESLEKEYNIKLPNVNFDKKYLYVTFGKRVGKIYDFKDFPFEISACPCGFVKWKTKYNPQKLYIYITEPRFIYPPEV